MFFYQSGDISIPLRALSDYEIDEARYAAMDNADDKIAGILLKVRLGLLNGSKIKFEAIPKQMYAAYAKFIIDVDMWIVYYAMCDFMPPDFTINDVKKLRHVHKMAFEILNYSVKPQEEVIKFVSTKEGKRLATLIYKFHVPLTDKMWKLTPLQEQFMTLSHPDALTFEGLDSMLQERIKHVRGK